MAHSTAADRRRVPRVEVTDTEWSVLEFPIQVRLLDISLGGVLLESTRASAVITARPAIGAALTRIGLGRLPEETMPPRALAALALPALSATAPKPA